MEAFQRFSHRHRYRGVWAFQTSCGSYVLFFKESLEFQVGTNRLESATISSSRILLYLQWSTRPRCGYKKETVLGLTNAQLQIPGAYFKF